MTISNFVTIATLGYIMKLRTIALTVAIATSALTAANAATKEITNGNFNDGLAGWGHSGQVTTVESYFKDAAFLGNGKKVLGTISQTFSLVTDSIVKLGFYFDTTKPLTVLLTSTDGYSWSKQLAAGQEFQAFSKKLELASGLYTLSFTSNGATVDSVKVNATSVQAVPGPEAGAGLGALTLGGIALWAKRRRKDDTASA